MSDDRARDEVMVMSSPRYPPHHSTACREHGNLTHSAEGDAHTGLRPSPGLWAWPRGTDSSLCGSAI